MWHIVYMQMHNYNYIYNYIYICIIICIYIYIYIYQSEGYPNGIFAPCAWCSLGTCQDGCVVPTTFWNSFWHSGQGSIIPSLPDGFGSRWNIFGIWNHVLAQDFGAILTGIVLWPEEPCLNLKNVLRTTL